MTRVLYCAYYFPPAGGAGVQRNSKFAKYLPELGVRPLVLTGPGAADDRWSPEDASLGEEIGAEVEVRRLPRPEPPRGSPGWRGRAERWLGLPTPWSRWWIDGLLEAGRAACDEIDVIYAAMAPFETAVAAARLSRELGKPWVADLQDPWALDEMWIYPTRLHRGNDTVRMRRLLASADAIVMNTPESAHLLLERLPELRSKDVVSIPNGFDGADFEAPVQP